MALWNNYVILYATCREQKNISVRHTREVCCRDVLLPWIWRIWLYSTDDRVRVRGTLSASSSHTQCKVLQLVLSHEDTTELWWAEDIAVRSEVLEHNVTGDIFCHPWWGLYAILLLSIWKSILAQGSKWWGAGVRCSANFLEGKGQEMTQNSSLLKGVWIAKRDQWNISLSTAELWPFIAMWNNQRG